MYQTEKEVELITQLCAGSQSLIWTVFDITYRMAVINPYILKKLVRQKGLCSLMNWICICIPSGNKM